MSGLRRAILKQVLCGRIADLEADSVDQDTFRFYCATNRGHFRLERRTRRCCHSSAEMAFRRVAEGVVDGLVVAVAAAIDAVLAVGQQHDRLDPFLVVVGLCRRERRGRRKHAPAPQQSGRDDRAAVGLQVIDGRGDVALLVGELRDRARRTIVLRALAATGRRIGVFSGVSLTLVRRSVLASCCLPQSPSSM